MGVDYSANGGYGIFLTSEQVMEIAENHKDKIILPENTYYDSVDELLEDGAYEVMEYLLKETKLSYVAVGSEPYGGEGGFIVGKCWSADWNEVAQKITLPDMADAEDDIKQFMIKFGLAAEIAIWSGVYMH